MFRDLQFPLILIKVGGFHPVDAIREPLTGKKTLLQTIPISKLNEREVWFTQFELE